MVKQADAGRPHKVQTYGSDSRGLWTMDRRPRADLPGGAPEAPRADLPGFLKLDSIVRRAVFGYRLLVFIGNPPIFNQNLKIAGTRLAYSCKVHVFHK